MLHGNWHYWYIIYINYDNLDCSHTSEQISGLVCILSIVCLIIITHLPFNNLSSIISRKNYLLFLTSSHVIVLSPPYRLCMDPWEYDPHCLCLKTVGVLIRRGLEPATIMHVPVIFLWNYSTISILCIGN